MLFLSGQIPIQPETGALVAGDVATQTRQVLANLATVLGDAGLALEDIVKTTVFLVSMDDFLAMNEVYAELMPEPYPARSTIAVAALPLGARVEIEVVARRPNA
jgi:2-iminobutanoate/2-iminopropanoate deaminase